MRDKTDPGTYDLMTGRLLLGYARVSTDDQELASQRDELRAVGCTRIFAEKITGTHKNRPEAFSKRLRPASPSSPARARL